MADKMDVKTLTGIIARLEAELETKPSKERKALLRKILEDARRLRGFVAKVDGVGAMAAPQSTGPE